MIVAELDADRRGGGHARAPIPHRLRLERRAATTAACLGAYDRRLDRRGRLRRRVPLRPRPGARPARPRTPTRAAARHRLQDLGARPQAGMDRCAARARRRARACEAPRRHLLPHSRAAHPRPSSSPAVITIGTSAAPARSTAGAETACSPRLIGICPSFRSKASQPACTSCSDCRPTYATQPVGCTNSIACLNLPVCREN
jgi:hypothetical protein